VGSLGTANAMLAVTAIVATTRRPAIRTKSVRFTTVSPPSLFPEVNGFLFLI
jgi:hypothetical protein